MSLSVPNENILKLRELSDELCGLSNSEYKAIVKQLKKMVEDGKSEVDRISTPQSKIYCYETMCSNITKLLNSVKIK
jgi:hypothetical protein